MQQLPLQVYLDKDKSFATFMGGDNQELLALLEHIRGSETEQHWFLWGESGVGKTHLLHSLANHLTNTNCIYLPLAEPGLTADVLDGLEHIEWVLLDGLEQVVNVKQWNVALFNLYNRIKDTHNNLVISAQQPPKNLKIELQDLASRLTAFTVYRLRALSDEQKRVLLQQQASLSGLTLPTESVDYMMQRTSRELSDLLSAIEQLDQASLVAQRKLTIPFIKQVLEL